MLVTPLQRLVTRSTLASLRDEILKNRQPACPDPASVEPMNF
jgi:hypothetical protein